MIEMTITLREWTGLEPKNVFVGWSSLEANFCNKVLYPPRISYFGYKLKFNWKLVIE